MPQEMSLKITTHMQPIPLRSIGQRLGAVSVSACRLALYFSLLLIVMFAVAQRGVAQTVKFNSPVTFPAGHPYVVSSADFNGDGKVDLVAGDITNNDLVMLLGNGDGTLKAPVSYHLTSAPRFIVANDFNRDGKLDVAVGDSTAPN